VPLPPSGELCVQLHGFWASMRLPADDPALRRQAAAGPLLLMAPDPGWAGQLAAGREQLLGVLPAMAPPVPAEAPRWGYDFEGTSSDSAARAGRGAGLSLRAHLSAERAQRCMRSELLLGAFG
jgi:hypothetical protein